MWWDGVRSGWLRSNLVRFGLVGAVNPFGVCWDMASYAKLRLGAVVQGKEYKSGMVRPDATGRAYPWRGMAQAW